jgi:hypothetical protein
MQGTNEARDRRRAERWVDRTGGLPYVPPAAFDLLIRRLAARRQVAVRCIPYYVAALAVMVSVGFSHAPGADGLGRAFAVRALIAYAILAFAQVRFHRLADGADRQIAQPLPHRVSRGTAVSRSTILGTARLRIVALAVVVEASLAVVLLLLGDGWLAWTYLVALAATCWFVAARTQRVAARATVAVDPYSLTIDERLRSEDVYNATGLLFLLLYAFPAEAVAGHGHAWLFPVWSVAAIGLQMLWVIGLTSHPWRPRWSWPPWFTTPPSNAGLS